MKKENLKVEIKPAKGSHIALKNPEVCQKKCEKKPCTYICPSDVYYWSSKKEALGIQYERCIECGACIFACPLENIDWHFPPPGHGVFYKY